MTKTTRPVDFISAADLLKDPPLLPSIRVVKNEEGEEEYRIDRADAEKLAVYFSHIRIIKPQLNKFKLKDDRDASD